MGKRVKDGREGAEVSESRNRMSLQLSNNYYRW